MSLRLFWSLRFDSTYGPVGISPLERERQLYPSDYLRLMLSGALAGVVRTFGGGKSLAAAEG